MSLDRHIPVLLEPILDIAAPLKGTWVDATLGAGGYTKGFLNAGAERVIGFDRDPSVFQPLASLKEQFSDRLHFVNDRFSNMAAHVAHVDGVVLDLGVSSMQLDEAERGFSFMNNGPLDMRMGQEGPSAADLVNQSAEKEIADILYLFGEERASRRIARRIVEARQKQTIHTTFDLVDIIKAVLPAQKKGQAHPATRSFQALRIAVNNEYDELFEGLHAAEKILKAGGLLMVVSFHSIEDRMVKRFFQHRAGRLGGNNRFLPEAEQEAPQFEIVTRKPIAADEKELAVNPRARSALLRVARRTAAQTIAALSAKDMGMPKLGALKYA